MYMYFDRLPTDIEELKGRFNSYVVTAFDDSMTVEMQLRSLVKRIVKITDLSNDLVDYMNNFIKTFDEKLYETVDDILTEWSKNGVIQELLDKWDQYFKEKYEELEKKYAKEIYNIKKMGVPVTLFEELIDDKVKHTKMFNKAIELASELGLKTLVPDGEYWIEATDPEHITNNYLKKNNGGIIVLDNTTLLMSDNTNIHVIPNDDKAYNLINVYDKRNVKIIGGNLIGDRNHNVEGRKGEWGYGIAIQGGTNITVKDVYVCDMWGDGINLQRCLPKDTEFQYQPLNVLIEGNTCDNNRRQGFSLEEGKNVVVKYNTFKNTKGTAPEAGMDIEPAWVSDCGDCPITQDIIIENNLFENNNGAGLLLVGTLINKTNLIVKNVLIKNNTFQNNGDKTRDNWGGFGVNLSRCDFITVQDNYFDKKQSVMMNSCGNVILNKNTLIDGFIIHDDTSVNGMSDIKITNNEINNISKHFFYKDVVWFQANGKKLVFSNNIVRNETNENILGMLKQFNHVEISFNKLVGGLAGCRSNGVTTNIYGNELYNQTSYPFVTSVTEKLDLIRNKVYNAKRSCVISGLTMNVYDNVIHFNEQVSNAINIEMGEKNKQC